MIKNIHIITLMVMLSSFSLVAQEVDISGVVKDEEEVPLPGVNVEVKGTDRGTSTDIDGKFSISAPSNDDVLVFSSVGFITQKRPLEKIQDKDDASIVLKESIEDLEEAVVVGYGEQKKSNVVGALSEHKPEQVTTRPQADTRSFLQGEVPGLNIRNSAGGDPSKNPSLNIRGFNSLNGGSPLTIVDGVPQPLSYVNPDDVESITVLKDAEASAIYGARAAFGVIEVKTKQAEEGNVKIEYSNNFGWSKNTARTDFITDPYKYAKTIDAAIGAYNGGNYTGYNDDDFEIAKKVGEGEIEPYHKMQPDGTYKFYYNTDFYDYMFKKTRPMEQHNISISGGSEQLSARLSGRIYEREKIQNIQDARMNRYNLKLNVKFKPYDWLEITGDSQFSIRFDEEYAGTKNGWGGAYGISRWRDQFPIFPPEIDDIGVSVGRTGGGYVARTAALKSGNLWRRRRYENLVNTISAKATPLEGLELNLRYSNRMKRTDRTFRYAPFEFLNGNKLELTTGGLDRSGEWRWKDRKQLYNFYGSYEISAAEKHNFKLMLGYEEQKYDRDRVFAQMEDFPVRDKYKLDLGTEMYDMGGSSQDWGLRSFFGRFNYDFEGKYLLEANARYDGSSRFPKNDRYGFFPSAAIGWKMDKEDFWKPIKDLVPTAKIRASWGQLGNQNVGLSDFTETIRLGKTSWLDENAEKLFYSRVPVPLPEEIGWETVTTENIGLDFGLFENKLTGSFDIYQKETKDMYVSGEPLPAVFGASEPNRSYASMRNRGFEFELAYSNSYDVGGSPLSLNVSANVSNNKGKITKYDNPQGVLSSYYEGQTLGEIWGYKTDGRFQSDEEAADFQNEFVNPEKDLGKVYSSIFNKTSNSEWDHLKAGDLKYKDLDDDGKIDNGDNTLDDPGDRKVIGNALPRYPFGFSIDAEWKGFSLSIKGQGVVKQDWYPTGPMYWGTYHRPYASFLRKDLVDNAWTEDDPGKYPQIERAYQALNGGRSLYNVNDHYLTNIGYLRIKNLTVGYQIPNELTEKVFLDRVRVYFSAENVFTWTFGGLTKYLDPEEAGSSVNLNNPSGANNRSNANENKYPMTKTYSVGVQVTL